MTITTASGAGAIDFTGAAPTITTSGDAVEFVGGSILLADGSDLTINTNISNASGAGGNITVAGRIVGTSDEDLTLTTGTAGSTGDVSVHQIGGRDQYYCPSEVMARSSLTVTLRLLQNPAQEEVAQV